MNTGEERRTVYIEPIDLPPASDVPALPIEPVPDPRRDLGWIWP
jgi:hypothetical protein